MKINLCASTPRKRSQWFGHFALLLFVLLLAPIPNAFSATTYYVAPTGSDSTTGLSLYSPFKTLGKAMMKAVAGDTVFVRGGTYREEVTAATNAGSAGNYIKVMAYNSEVPVIKGSDVVTGWTQHSGAIWKKTGWATSTQQVFVDFDAKPGKPLQQIGMPSKSYTSFTYPTPVGTGLSSMTAGSFYYDPASYTLYVWLADGSSPNNHVMEVSKRRRLFFMGKPYIHVKGLHFRHTNGSTFAQQSSAVEMSSNSILENCDVQWADFGGVGMGYLQNNAQVINCNISNNGATGVSSATSSFFKVSGSKLNGNNYRNFNPLWHAGGLKGTADSYGTIEFNEVANNKGSGIWFDNCDSGGQIVVRNNYVHNNGVKEAGIFMEVSKNALIYNNVVVNNQRRGIYVSASSNNQVMNNTIVGTSGYAALEVNGMPRTGATLTNNTVYNNVISGSTAIYDLFIAAPNGSTIANNKSNYNNIYRGGQALKLSSSTLVSTLSAWRSATGYDLNSISDNPDFVGSGSAAAYAVLDVSPVINKGMSLSTLVPNDYLKAARPAGGAYDMGAFEKGGTTTSPTPSPSPSPTPTTGDDNTAPVVSFISLPTSTAVDGSLKITATATDNVGVVGMSLFIDGTKVASSTSGQVSYVWDLTNVRIGTHTLYASARDAAQNNGTDSASIAILDSTADAPTSPTTTTSDTSPPIIKIASPLNGASVYAGGTMSISASATDNKAVTTMKIYVDGVVKAQTSSGSVSYSWNTSGARIGSHAVRVTASDAAQNSGSGNVTVYVK